MESLFEQGSAPTFEKTAAPIQRLSENPQTWDNEILAALYRQHSYLGKFSLELVKRGEESERGYLFGHFAVSNVRELPPQQMQGAEVTNPTLEQEQMLGNPVTRIPVIVRARHLYPFDVFITLEGKFLPLTEERLSQSMLQMEPMELGSQQQASTGFDVSEMAPQTAPPGRMGGGRIQTLQEKTGSVNLLDMALTTIQPLKKQAFIQSINADTELAWAFEQNPLFRAGVLKIASAEPVSADQLKTAINRSLPADVVQFLPAGRSMQDGLIMKSAAARGYDPQTEHIPARLMQAVPPEVIQGVLKHGSVTLAVNPRRSEFPDESVEYTDASTADSYGVLTKESSALQGIVIPRVNDIDNSDTGHRLFLSNDQQDWSMQEKIAAVAVPPGPGMVDAVGQAYRDTVPRNQGCFVKVAGANSEALWPMDVGPTVRDANDNVYYTFSTGTMLGKFALVEGLQKVAMIEPGVYGIPSDWSWVPLRRGGMRQLMDSPDMLVKAASAEAHFYTVNVHYNGDYSLDGAPVDQVPRHDRDGIKEAQARMLLCLTGVETDMADTVLEKAAQMRDAKIYVARHIVPRSELMKEAQTSLEAFVADIDVIPLDLVKVAAAPGVGMADPESVDAVLSLGFITPDNLMGFVNNIDLLEQAVSSLSEMLIASRVGSLPDIPETSVERAVKAIEKTLQGLKALEMRMQQDEEQQAGMDAAIQPEVAA